MNNRCLMVAGGTVEQKFLEKYLQENQFRYIFAVDRGLEALAAIGVLPTHMVGDFDSIASEIRESYEQNEHISVCRLIPEKDDTDTQHAINMAVELGVEEITIIGGFGTRFDHMLANVHTLQIPHRAGICAYMVDEVNRVSLVSANCKILRAESYGPYISFLPLTEQVTGVSLKGFKYPLKDFTFSVTSCFGLGVSNELTTETAEIMIESGILIMIEAKEA
ncbi:MAG: thiamine diphosphokinase [Lachnospiraceae bacterium]|nr:thiamine diphosphokinase [Lachnospiraceae bacterium]